MKQKDFYTIGISCIGSGVGQSVITSCRLSNLPIKTVGFGTNAFAFGAYECDVFDYTPTIYADNFVDKLIEKCKEHKVDLLIPGRDDEALIYAQNKSKFDNAGIKTLVAGQEIIEICRDKEKMSLDLNPIVNVFVECYDRADLENIIKSGKADFPLIAKPRGGFASKGIEIILNETDFHRISDEHIIQELAIPLESDPNYQFYTDQIAKNNNPQVSEISIQVVLGVNGELLGKMASFNKLNNGVPIEIVPYEDEQVWEIVDKLLPVFKQKGFVGPLNIQGRLTKKGLKLFEMNPRFTGITGLRALMGFNEVEACIKSWLGISTTANLLTINNNRFGIRQTTDKSISLDLNQDVIKFSRTINGQDLKPKRTLAITGAGGFLGRCLIDNLTKDNLFEIVVFGRDVQKLENLFPDPNVKKYSYSMLDDGTFTVGSIDVLIHLAFARPHCTNTEVAESLAFTNDLFTRLAHNQVPAIINLSTQSVYGQESEPLWTEESTVAPKIPYAQAKYATELMLKSIKKLHPHISITSLRLAALSGGQSGLKPVDFLSKLVNKALLGEEIEIEGGQQQLEIMDVRDAVKFISAILNTSPKNWHPIYNIGAGEIYSLSKIAEQVVKTVKEQTNVSSRLHTSPSEINIKFGMDNNLITRSFNINPSFKLQDIIDSLIYYFNEKKFSTNNKPSENN